MGAKIVYGAWITEEVAGKRIVATMEEFDFMRELKLALLDNGKDVDAAIERVKKLLTYKVREALA